MTSREYDFTRRGFMVGAGALAAVSAIPAWALPPSSEGLGAWFDDDFGLAAYRYAGPLRFPDSPIGYGFEDKPQQYLGNDPYFLLGNYRLTLITHASGQYQILTGERAWARMNQGEQRWSGVNRAVVTINGQQHELVGIDGPAPQESEKRFGAGFARYDYKIGDAKITRLLSVAPSPKVHEGTSAFLVKVRLRNDGKAPLKIAYLETTLARYQQAMAAWEDSKAAWWTNDETRQAGDNLVVASFTAHEQRPLTFPPEGEMYRLEAHPPALFVKALGAALPSIEKGQEIHLGAKLECELAAGEQKDFAFIVGYSRDASPQVIEKITEQLAVGATRPLATASAFADEWRSKLPAFADESDPALRREMRWNTAVLEQMATWREYYNETVIPQGTMYDYLWGWMASSRDLAQQALPFCHTNPALARSTLRFILKRTMPDGEVKLNDQGYGWVGHAAMQTSDQQLHFFLLLAEYLRKTRDVTILDEKIGYYPAERCGSDTGWAHLRQTFSFLRDRIGTGPHRLVKLWNSDWNDLFYFLPIKHPYNSQFEVAESLMNTAMAIVLLKDLPDQLDQTGRQEAKELSQAMREYRAELLAAWNADLGERSFPRRAWISYNESYGENEIWLEPQGYALQIPEMSRERKQRLLAEVEKRLMDGEALGARQQENPPTYDVANAAKPGIRENGGFWFSLNGPLILGVATFDRKKSWSLLRRMMFANYASSFPNYWSGRWTNADSIESSLSSHKGLTPVIGFCAHPHGWPLYCYLRLKEDEVKA